MKCENTKISHPTKEVSMKKCVRFYYFDSLPILELRPPAISRDDPRLKSTHHFKHKFETWESVYKKDIFHEIEKNGVIDPLICLYENGRWRIEPGQTRWLALWYMGYETQKVIAMVRDCDDFTDFLKFNPTEITCDQTLYQLFTDSKDKLHVGYDYITKRRDMYMKMNNTF